MAHMFEIGDKVRVVRYPTFGGLSMPVAGDTGVVNGHVTSDAFYNIVRLDKPDFPTNGLDNGWRCVDEWLEPVPERRFNVGDRVQLTAKGVELAKDHYNYYGDMAVGDVGVVMGEDGDWYDVDFDKSPIKGFAYSEDALEAYVGRQWRKPGAARIDATTIDRWVEEGVKSVQAQETLGYDEPSFTISSGDAVIVVENGVAKLYRMEAVCDVE